MYNRAVRSALMHEHELEDPTAFETLVREKEIHLSRDYFLNSWTVKNVRSKRGYAEDQTCSHMGYTRSWCRRHATTATRAKVATN